MSEELKQQFDLETIGRIMHESWAATKRGQGFVGPFDICPETNLPHNARFAADHKCKFHADLIPWEELPEPQKDINRHAFDAVLPYFAQVCEQREKEHASTCCGDAHGDLAAFQDRMEAIGVSVSVTVENGVRVRHIKNTGAEAAELALQAASEEHEELMAAVKTERNSWRRVAENLETEKVTLRAALQAKEQELQELRANLDNAQQTAQSLMDNELSYDELQQQLAQARQQAVAECARIVFDEGYEAVAHRLRSLTPPPALTQPSQRLTETEEFAMLLCQAAWEVEGSDTDRLGKVRELLAAYGERHPLPPALTKEK